MASLASVRSSLDSFSCLMPLNVGGQEYHYYSIDKAAEKLGIDAVRLPQSHKILLERMLAREDGDIITVDHIIALAQWMKDEGRSDSEIYLYANRVLLQDLTGGPLIGDLAGMRDVLADHGVDPKRINPMVAVDLVVDHSVIVQTSGTGDSLQANTEHEFRINHERFTMMKWAGRTFNNMTVTPPGLGICHQQMIERLNPVIEQAVDDQGRIILSPSYLIGTDSHTTMAGALSVMAYGVGGIEAEATMLGQPLSLVIPDAIGVRLAGKLGEGMTATDLALTITERLRQVGVVEKAVVFYGPGVETLTLADRATISNMAPEYGATVGLFAIDHATLEYLRTTGRTEEQIAIVEAYARAQSMWADANTPDPLVTQRVDLDLGEIQPSMAGPKQPKERVNLPDISERFWDTYAADAGVTKGVDKPALPAAIAAFRASASEVAVPVVKAEGADGVLHNGDYVIAAITSCTNTSNPGVMVAAGLVAKKAVELGLKVPEHVKTSLAPGSKAVSGYLEGSGLQQYLDHLGFNVVGFGCTTCIGNSGPLLGGVAEAIDAAKKDGQFRVAAVLSGNRNFQGRVHASADANFLASPPLVVAAALAGNVNKVIRRADAFDPATGQLREGITEDRLGLGRDREGSVIYLEDIWPTSTEIDAAIRSAVTRDVFVAANQDVGGSDQWKKLPVPEGDRWEWDIQSRYYSVPPYFQGMSLAAAPVQSVSGGRILGIYGHSITTDDISPASPIGPKSPAGVFLRQSNVPIDELHSFGARRGDPRVIDRGAWGNPKVQNLMVGVKDRGSATIHYAPGQFADGTVTSVYDAAQQYKEDGVRPVVFAGKEYGTGSSRDLAAKSPRNLGVAVVLAESFERIHRANLASMGVLPLQLPSGTTLETLKLKGNEVIDVKGMETLAPRCDVIVSITRDNGSVQEITTRCRIDTNLEMSYYKAGGIPVYVTRKIIEEAANDNPSAPGQRTVSVPGRVPR